MLRSRMKVRGKNASKHLLFSGALFISTLAGSVIILAQVGSHCFDEMVSRDNATLEQWQSERDRIDQEFIQGMIDSDNLARLKESQAMNLRNAADQEAEEDRAGHLRAVNKALELGNITEEQAESANGVAESIYRIALIQNSNAAELRRRKIALEQEKREITLRTRADLEDEQNDANRDSMLRLSYLKYLECNQANSGVAQ